MTLRTIAAAIGAFLGLAIWYILVSSMGLTTVAFQTSSNRTIKHFLASMVFCVLTGGVFALSLGEKLRLIPTQERVNEKAKPPSIL